MRKALATKTAMSHNKCRLTQEQSDFFWLDCQFPAFVGGFGSGKTQSMISRALRDKFAWPQSTIALYEPTYDLARLILVPRLTETLEMAGVHYMHNKSENVIYLLNRGKFVIRTLDKPNRIVGYEAFRSHVDEIDTLPKKHAADAWRKIIARNRQKLPGLPLNQVCAYTTPEGFNFVYDTWEGDPDAHAKGYYYVRASTRSNIANLPPGYIASLYQSYPAHLVDAYIEGLFVNMTSGAVYVQFNRLLNHIDIVEAPREPLHVGMDFNVARGCAAIHIIRDGYPIAVGEIVNTYDTPATIRALKETYPDHAITVYPDAAGHSRKSVGATTSDIQLLKAAGFIVKEVRSNPPIKNRVAAVNAKLCDANGRRSYFINTNKCPYLTAGFEQQAYDKNGLPEKGVGKMDDIVDAAGYFIVRLWPIKRQKIFQTRLVGL